MRLLILLAAFAAAPALSQPAPCTAEAHRQLDYWVGEWDLSWTGTNTIAASHNGCVIEERFADASGFTGHSVSMYDARAGTWRQTWVDNQGSYLTFTGTTRPDGTLEFRQPAFTNAQGAEQVNRMIWEDVTDAALTWRWQRSLDGGATWADAWVIAYRRR
jgi:hypothetical protein